jgi:S1-C subfamily serine protease
MKTRLLLVWVLLSPLGLLAHATEQPRTDGTVTKLAPFTVKDDPINSFGFDLNIYQDRKTKKITRIFFGEIKPGSSAEELDILPGDQIVKINGRPVTDFPARIDAGSELGKLLLAREPGEKLDLEIVRHRRETVTVQARSVSRFGR